MNETIEYYDKNAAEFCRSTVNADMSGCRNRFLQYLPKGAFILDAGCGSGRDSKAFMDAGFQVTAMDASSGVCAEAEKLLGQEVLCVSFQDMTFDRCFDGIWSCASLLHVPEAEMEEVLGRMGRALKDKGILYVSFKYGDQERITNGRFFNDYNEDKLKNLLEHHSFRILEMFISQDVREGRSDEKWINAIGLKKAEYSE